MSDVSGWALRMRLPADVKNSVFPLIDGARMMYWTGRLVTNHEIEDEENA